MVSTISVPKEWERKTVRSGRASPWSLGQVLPTPTYLDAVRYQEMLIHYKSLLSMETRVASLTFGMLATATYVPYVGTLSG